MESTTSSWVLVLQSCTAAEALPLDSSMQHCWLCQAAIATMKAAPRAAYSSRTTYNKKVHPELKSNKSACQPTRISPIAVPYTCTWAGDAVAAFD